MLNTLEQSFINERKIVIITDEQRHELSTDLFSTWTPEQVQEFLDEWNNDEPLQQLILDEASEPMRQHGRGEKRTIDEVNNGDRDDNNNDVNNGASTSNQGDDDNERYFSLVEKVSEKAARSSSPCYKISTS